MEALRNIFIRLYTWRLRRICRQAAPIVIEARTASNPMVVLWQHQGLWQRGLAVAKRLTWLLRATKSVLSYDEEIHRLFPSLPMIPKNGFEFTQGVLYKPDGSMRMEKTLKAAGFKKKEL